MKNKFAVGLDVLAYVVAIVEIFLGIVALENSPYIGVLFIVGGVLCFIFFHTLAEVLNLLEAIKENTSRPHYILTSTLPEEYASAPINDKPQGLPKI